MTSMLRDVIGFYLFVVAPPVVAVMAWEAFR